MMLILFNLILLGFFSPNPKSPKDFIWKNRVLIIQQDESDSGWFSENLKQDLQDRKLLVFHFDGKILVNTNCEEDINAADFLKKLEEKSPISAAWVLVGLDGGIKNSGKEPPSTKEIFQIIDAMPMRQSEIRKSGE